MSLLSPWYDWDFDTLVRNVLAPIPFRTKSVEDGIRYEFDVPGMKPENMEVFTENGVLIVKGERDGTSMMASVRLPRAIDINRVEAELENGVLALTLPKSEEAKPRRIELSSGGRKAIE